MTTNAPVHKATPGKKYTLTYIDLFSPDWAPIFAENNFSVSDSWFHWSIANMDGDVSSGTPLGPFLSSGNPLSVPNTYVFLLFEHDEAIDTSEAFAYLNETSFGSFVFATYMEKLGLGADQLIAANWWSVSGGIEMVKARESDTFLQTVVPDVVQYCETLTSGLPDSGILNACPSQVDQTCAQFAKVPPPVNFTLPGDYFDVSKVQAAAEQLLVQGIGTIKDGKSGYLDHVDNLKQVLKVSFARDGIAELPEDAADMNLTCGRKWTCAAAKLDVCPNVALNTLEVASDVPPVFEWEATC